MLMPRDGRKLLAALWAAQICALLALPAQARTPPRVLGYERISTTSAADLTEQGLLLLGELNCTSCHRAGPALESAISRKPAPILDTVGSRVQPSYLLRFLADPQVTKPGTTMPHVLAGDSDAERTQIVESLVHFLASTGQVTHANPARLAVTRGETLFHSIGCLACHDPRTDPAAKPLATSIPLGTPSKKYTLPGLAQFLQDPLTVRPGGRMPHLNLTPGEARDIASFLLNDLDIVSGLQYAYYEGDWNTLPNFSKLTPVAAGEADDFDLRLAKRSDHFALRFEGTLTVPQEGDYLFLIGSDDGARLLIDDKVVVVNDGIHAYQQKRKRQKMTAGEHSVVVEYFDYDGEESLAVEFEPPGKTQQPLAALLSASAIEKGTASAVKPFAVNPRKAAKGREYFSSQGCAACHTLNSGASPIQATNRAPDLQTLGSGGCLSGDQVKTPRYGLSEQQQAAIQAALKSLKQGSDKSSPRDIVRQSLVRFNCITCHDRDGLGGVEESRNAFFQSDMPEMGDEGRLPPSLTGVGAKLQHQWLDTLLDKGADDRTYMFTRMPKFGRANVGALVTALEHADATLIKSAPVISISSEDERRVRAAGRRLVGSQGFSCIKCHTFAGLRSSGIQAISLTTMTQRLRPAWFHNYLQNPLQYRPGTRMPTPFPDGQTTLPGVLDGTVNGQIAAIWSYLSDGNKATYPVGLVTGKIELIAFDEPVIFRNFIQGAGTRAIGVGYPEKLNLAFDAENLRLALLWHGGFIDAARHWSARGAGFEKPLGDKVLELPAGTPFAELDSMTAAWPTESAKKQGFQFRGYRLDAKKRPTFQYSWNEMEIEEQSFPIGDQDLFAMQRTISIRAASKPKTIAFRAARSPKIHEMADGTYKIDGQVLLRVNADGKPILRETEGHWELLVPLVWHDGVAKIELTYDW
jgi:mono/diheme cytochrome c family protein